MLGTNGANHVVSCRNIFLMVKYNTGRQKHSHSLRSLVEMMNKFNNVGMPFDIKNSIIIVYNYLV